MPPRLSLLCPLTLGALALIGCYAATSHVEFVHTQLPAKPYGCPVNRIADPRPPYPVEDLVVVTLTYTPGGQDQALRKLDDDACYYGGDTVYKLSELARNTGTTELTATIARRPGGAPGPEVPPPAASVAPRM